MEQPTSLDSIRVLRQQLETIILAESTAFEQSVNNFNLRMEALQTQLRNLKREEALLENQNMPRPAEPQRQPQKANHHHLRSGAPAFLPSGTGSVPLGQTPFFSPVVPQFKKQQPPPTRQPRPLPPSSAPYAKPSSVHVPAGGAVTAPKTATPSVHDVPPPRAVRAVSGELAPRRSSAQLQGAPSSFAPPSLGVNLAASRRRPQSTAAALAGGSTEVRSTREECCGLHTAEVDESQSGESLHGDCGAAMVAADPMASLSMLFPQPGSHAASVSRITSIDAVNANAETVATMAPADHSSDGGGGDNNSPKRLDGEDRAHGGGRQTGPRAHTGDALPNKGLMPVARSEASPRAAPAHQEPVSSCVDSATGSEDHRHPIAPRKRGVAACTNGSPHETSTDFDDILAGRYCRDSNGSSSPLASSAAAIEASSRVAFNDEEFPSLPAAATSGSLASNPWAKGSQLVAQLSADAVDVSCGAAPGARAGALAGVEEVAITAGLRPADVALPGDIERRQQLRRRGFQLWDSDGKGRREVNVVEGLELFESVLGPEEQALIVKTIESWEQAGRENKLRGRTFSAPRRWMPGKGRITMQFGACYNYARDSEGRDPGIIPEEVVEPMPPLLSALARRLVRWGVLPASKEPDSAIINLYEEGDCIPPHIDHHDFTRPFCTLSLLSRQTIMFGRRLVPQGPGEFVELSDRALHIPLAPGSCLVLKGNGADLAMHCVPPVSDRRISITLRKMGAPHRDLVMKEVKDMAAAEGHPDARLKGFWEC